MLGIEDYGSDVESDDETSKTSTATSRPLASTSTSTLALLSKLPPPTSKSTFALPPPTKSSSSSLALPAPSSSTETVVDDTIASQKSKRTKKIAIHLPSLPPSEDDADAPPAKRSRTAPSAGAGKSSLLSMLPAPKQPALVIEKRKEERVLGGGGGPGLLFRTQASASVDTDVTGGRDITESEADVAGPSTSFVPPSLKRGRANISVEDEGLLKKTTASGQAQKTSTTPPANFFSLGSSDPSSERSTPARTTTPLTSSIPPVTGAPSATSSFTISSAPTISTFRPPSPKPDDAYPGYYQLPSGAYAPYDPDYYASYAQKWQAAYDKHIRALEKAQYEPETDSANVDMAAEMEKARREIKEREDRKALTTGKVTMGEDGEPVKPKMNVQGAKLGAVARSRHQLTTLLTEAYLNRDALEEKIAQGRRNRKEAGNKYGF